MQYNTQQKRMPLPEYGRSIQNMVDHALTIRGPFRTPTLRKHNHQHHGKYVSPFA